MQNREIAAAQDIPESYLNQLLVTLRRAGLVRSVRGAAGGYTLHGSPASIAVADVVRVFHGEDYFGGRGPGTAPADDAVSAAWVVSQAEQEAGAELQRHLAGVTLADLLLEQQRLNAAQSLMQGL